MEESKLTPELLDNIKDGDLSKVGKDELLDLYRIIRNNQNHYTFIIKWQEKCHIFSVAYELLQNLI